MDSWTVILFILKFHRPLISGTELRAAGREGYIKFANYITVEAVNSENLLLKRSTYS